MLCNNCEYLYYPEYESNYTSCRVFGEEIPEEYERKDGEGCKCNKKQLDKLNRKNEEAWLNYVTDYVNWLSLQEEGEEE